MPTRPTASKHVLEAAREVVAGSGRVLVVFGCGGDRDATKRPFMGAEAEAGADIVVVTSDNPRHEDPQAIVDAVLRGMTERPYAVELDRRRAIGLALEAAAEADVVVIAGKGHETTQQIGDTVSRLRRSRRARSKRARPAAVATAGDGCGDPTPHRRRRRAARSR